MLSGTEIRALSTWCGVRDLSWFPLGPIGKCDVMTLRSRDSRRPWQSMRLVLDEEELRLETELGETLATASDLPALLDAVDGGVAEPPPLPPRVLAGLMNLPDDTLRVVMV